MRTFAGCLAGLLVLASAAVGAEGKKVAPVLDFKMKGINGQEVNLAQYQGKVVLLVNVASRCGYTKQYKGLQALHDKYAKDGLVIIGVPANEFGAQEPGSDEEIQTFCKSKYGVQFPMLSKVVVKGKGIAPLYQYLTSTATDPKFGGPIKWNFTKFLIGRNGEIVGRFEPKVTPEQMTRAIEAELKK